MISSSQNVGGPHSNVSESPILDCTKVNIDYFLKVMLCVPNA